MMTRVHNFGAGPCTLPVSVLEAVRDEFLDFEGIGMSIIEDSHRAPPTTPYTTMPWRAFGPWPACLMTSRFFFCRAGRPSSSPRCL